MTTTREVLDHHIAAFGAGDVDGVLDDYTDESLLISPNGVVRGRKELRTAFEGLFAGLFAPGTYDLTTDTLEVEGEVAFFVWHADCASARIDFAADTFLVRDGKIAVQTFAAKIDPR
jgi:ketosteroid isomerase-like protein